MIVIGIQNQSTAVSDKELQDALPGLQAQISEDFAPAWGYDAKLQFVPVGTPWPAGAWQMLLKDDSDQQGALGYHEIVNEIPWGVVFAKTDVDAGLSWTVTLSHELLEMLLDPYVFSVVAIDQQSASGMFHGGQVHGTMLAQEVADAVESDSLASTKNGILVTNWVTPQWFGAPGKKFDFGGHCQQPFQILTGGYIGVRQYRAGQWGQVNARMVPTEDDWHIMRKGPNGMEEMPLHEIPRDSRRWRRLAQNKNTPGPFTPIP